MSLLKGSQICVAASLAGKAEEIREAIKKLSEQARAAGLHEFAHGFEVIADGTTRVGIELEQAARSTFVAARRGEKLPS